MSTYWIWSRPWCAVISDSLRVSVHLTGLPSRRATRRVSTSSGVDLELPAEPTTDVGRDHAQLVLRDAGDQRQHHPQDVRDLGGRPQREVVALRLHDDRARLHERRDEPLLHEPPADDDIGVGERLLGVTGRAGLPAVEDEVEAGVRVQVVVDQVGAVLDGLLHVQDRRQDVVVDVDQLDGVLCGDLAARDDQRHGLAHVVDRVDGDRGVSGVDHVGGDRPRAGDRALLVREVPTREDGDDARGLLGRADVDAGDPRVRDRAADDGDVQHAGQDHVVGPRRPAGDQPGVLLASAGLADLLLRRLNGRRLVDHGHDCAPSVSVEALISAAACCTARTMFW
jgi:hypothetical protein